MFKFFKKLGWFSPALTEQMLADYAVQIQSICHKIEQQNLAIVNDSIENTSGHNNYKLVQAAIYFVTECNWVFNTNYAQDYSSAEYFVEFIRYIREVEEDFDQRHDDPDGVGGGTITDVVNTLKTHAVVTY